MLFVTSHALFITMQAMFEVNHPSHDDYDEVLIEKEHLVLFEAVSKQVPENSRLYAVIDSGEVRAVAVPAFDFLLRATIFNRIIFHAGI